MTRLGRQNTALGEIYTVWILFGLATIAVFETYWRFPPQELWKVSHSGLAGGASRAFVFLSFSPALAAIAVLLIVADRLDDRRARLLAYLSLVLCATVAIPGVQTPGDLDPKWSNSPAVIGVCLAVALTVWASLGGRPEAVRTRVAGDVARLGVGLVSLFFAAPYIAAELGFFLDGVPVLGWIFQTGRLRAEPGGGYIHAAVHHGHHHGLDGFLLDRDGAPALAPARWDPEPRPAAAHGRVSRADGRLRADERGPGRVARAGRQARLDGRGRSRTSWNRRPRSPGRR